MSIVLITGGNKGLGYETAKRLKGLGHQVVIAARNEERGTTAANTLGVDFVQLDVRDEESITRAVNQIQERYGTLDVLINNAGISGIRKSPEAITGADMQTVFDTNVFGIVRVTHACIPLLRGSKNPVIVNVSSGLGSFGLVTDPATEESRIPSLTYCSAKAAVSMLTVQYAKALPEIKVNCVDPGSTATDLNGGRGKQTIQEGTDAIVELATIGKGGPTGVFRNRNGKVPW